MDNISISTSEFWSRIKSRLRAKGITYENAALACGFNLNTFRNWAGRNIIPSTEDTFRLARFLDLSVEYLMTGKKAGQSAEIQEIRDKLKTVNKQLDSLSYQPDNVMDNKFPDTVT